VKIQDISFGEYSMAGHKTIAYIKICLLPWKSKIYRSVNILWLGTRLLVNSVYCRSNQECAWYHF